MHNISLVTYCMTHSFLCSPLRVYTSLVAAASSLKGCLLIGLGQRALALYNSCVPLVACRPRPIYNQAFLLVPSSLLWGFCGLHGFTGILNGEQLHRRIYLHWKRKSTMKNSLDTRTDAALESWDICICTLAYLIYQFKKVEAFQSSIFSLQYSDLLLLLLCTVSFYPLRQT